MEFTPDAVQITHNRQQRRRRRGLVALLLGLSAATVGAGAFSLAYFTDTDTSTGDFTAGTIILGVSPTAAYNVTNMFPGDVKSAALTLSNTGTGQLRYSMTTAITSGASLAGQLTAVVKDKGAGCTAFDGTILYSGPLGVAAFGNPAITGNVGDPTLDSGASTDVCFQVTMPTGTGNAFQGASTAVTFTFDSEQTANNP